MNKLDRKEIKQVLLDILIHFHKFCEENKLTYYLAYGTLLGAVRHKGFIPWDDDIDVYMLRKDYDFLIKNFNNLNNIKNLNLLSIYSNIKYYKSFPKIVNNNTITNEKIKYKFPIGLWIDIFPLDNMSNSYKKAFSLHRKVKLIQFFFNYKVYNLRTINSRYKILKNTIHCLIKFFVFFIPNKYFIRKIDDISQKYKDNSRYIGYVASDTKKPVLEREWFKERVFLDFEGYSFWAPKEWDKVLKNNYGNYMQLPPENKRIGHLIEAYWKE